MPRDGHFTDSTLRRHCTLARTISRMELAGHVTLPPTTGIPGPDARFVAVEAEILHLLSLPTLTDSQIDRLQQLDDWVAFAPAAGLVGAAVKVRRLLCPQEGLFTGRMHRHNGADQAAMRDVLRLVGGAAKRSPANGLDRRTRA